MSDEFKMDFLNGTVPTGQNDFGNIVKEEQQKPPKKGD